MDELPIYQSLDQIVRSLQEERRAVIVAPPGSGKTTGIAPRLMEVMSAVTDASGGQGKILLLQPRRMAARTVARRLAQLVGCEVGQEVGYQVRMERHWNRSTRIVVMTYGVLLRRLQSDPMLEDFSVVLFDEFHERSLESDLALAMLHRVHFGLRPELALGVMSATMEGAPVADYLQGAPIIESEGRKFPVDIRYAQRLSKERIENDIARLIPNVLRETSGHLLVFLPGVGEIRRLHQQLRELAERESIELLQLYGDLPPQQQDRVLQDSGLRKVILATNVAETSITIPGVTAVIDSGVARVLRVDPAVGLPRLDIEPISIASADQRAGRAGRTAPGICHRMWLQPTHRSRRAYDLPEILRGDLTSAVLQLYGWGEVDILAFPWLTPPAEDAVAASVNLLETLGAIAGKQITVIGRRMLNVPTHPRLARLLLEAQRRGCVEAASIAAALLAERDPFVQASSDLVENVDQMLTWIHHQEEHNIRRGAAHTIKQTAQHLAESLREEVVADDVAKDHEDGKTPWEEALGRSLLMAFPDRVACRRTGSGDRARMVGGVGIKLRNLATLRPSEFYLCLDLLRKSGDADVRLAVSIEESWLQGENLREVDECFFHPSQRKVVGRRRKYWLDLLLSETPTEVVDTEAATAILAEQLNANWNAIYPADDAKLNQLLARINLLRRLMPELDLPQIDSEWLQQTARGLCIGKKTLEEVRGGKWLEAVWAEVGYDKQRLIDLHAPVQIRIPSGREATIEYSEGQPPTLAVRLQELFGMRTTPRVAQNRQPLLMRILAPNYREVQVTQDLESFWSNAYHQIRKELKRRYPKHQWPEDPQSATATKSGLSKHEKPDSKSAD